MADTFVVQIDTPSIKKYVFGTDALNEVRGASARLDWLNRQEMGSVLRERVAVVDAAADVEEVYANGGSAQFLVRGCDEMVVDASCRALALYVREQTGGEVQVAYGIGPLADDALYREAVRGAHFQLRCRREFASGHRAAATVPLVMECGSASHLPAAHSVARGAEGVRMLSAASYRKVHEGWQTRDHGVWVGWMKRLQQKASRWPGEERWNDLRFQGMTDLGEQSNDQVGIVYADGNAMGEVVQALDSLETCRQFSRIVDESIREACFAGLARTCQDEIEGVSQAIEEDRELPPLPADILLLGGDDLLVAVPADRALDFALHVTVEFERLTREKIAALEDQGTQQFFRDRTGDCGFTISCGVAIARSTFPFYLSLDLAEQLLTNAKRREIDGTRDPDHSASIDFHVVAGANSHDLKNVRTHDYHVLMDGAAPRTLRPYTCSQLESLRTGIRDLRQAGFPRSKLHALREAALAETEQQTERGIREVFSRCRHGPERSERRALWNAVSRLCPGSYELDFPWFRKGRHRLLCVADIVDAYDLFGGQG